MLMKIAKRVKKQLPILAGILSVCGVMATSAHAIPFSSISEVYFFGDSLTDSGFSNLWPFAPVGKAPTFTTYGGYTWAQYVARDVKGYTLPTSYPTPPGVDTITNNQTPTNGPGFVNPVLTGIDFACGGSTTDSTVGVGITYAPSLHQQITHFLSLHPAGLDPAAVYFVWSGANDILKVLSQPTLPTELELLQTANSATTNVANEITRLVAAGAKRVVVMSLPNIGSTPLIQGLATTHPTLPADMKNLSFTFDTMLNVKLGAVIKQTGVKILYVNTYAMLDDLVNAAKSGKPYTVGGVSFNFTNYTDQACAPALTSLNCANNGLTGYVFADSVHPTDMSHRALSLNVEQLIRQWS